MKNILFLLLVAGAYTASGQSTGANTGSIPSTNRVFFTTSEGRPISSLKYSGIISGSPYFSETWMKGTISANGGTEYANVLIRIDLVENIVIYLGPNNMELTPGVPTTKVSLLDTLTNKTYRFVNSSSIGDNSEGIWYQELVPGKATLYKQFVKTISDASSYGTAASERSVRTEVKYYVQINNKVTKLKKLKDIVDLVPDKKTELSAYIENGKFNGKKEADYIAVVNYYNSL